MQYVEYKDQITFFSGEEFGRYTFTGVYSGNAFADFLLGLPQFTGYSINTPDANPYATHFAGYLQDDWKPTDQLTVNLGVRYDLRSPMKDRSNQMGNFDRDYPGGRVIVANEGVLAKVPCAGPQLGAEHALCDRGAGRSPRDAALRGQEQRQSTPEHRLSAVQRQQDRVAWRRRHLHGAALRRRQLLHGRDGDRRGRRVLEHDARTRVRVPEHLIGHDGAGRAAARVARLPASEPDATSRIPRVTQWTVTIDRDLGWNTGLRVSYVGSKTTDLVYSPDLNQVRPNTLGYAAVAGTRPFTDWNVVTTRDNGAQSRYDALGVELSKRLSRGIAFNASYTLAKNIADHGGAVPGNYTGENGATTLDLFRGASDRGNEAFTRRHRFVSTFFAELPFGRGRTVGADMPRALDALVGGWDLTGIALLQSGPYLTPFFSNGDPSGTGTTVRGFTASQRPDCIGSGTRSNPTADAYFDAGAFVRPANNIGRFGSCGVGILEGPGTKTFSLTLGKWVPLAGTSKLRVEASVANLFDVENLDIPGTMNITSSAFGRITRTQPVDQAGPRTVQFSLRYTF